SNAVPAPKPEEPANPVVDTQSTAAAPAQPSAQPSNPSPDSKESTEVADNGTEADAEVAQAVAQADADAGLADEQPRKSSNTGWYIGILVILVGVVIWLVMYASKSMKETGAALSENKAGEKEIREAKRVAKEEQNKMREQYANSLISKNEEIKQLKSQAETLEKELDSARRESDALRRELNNAKRELSDLRHGHSEQPATTSVQKPQTEQKPQASKARPGALPPVVFLGYVNQRGLFVKAFRTLNVESTVYRMDIPDGQHGLFRVVNDPDILDRLLSDTSQWLEGGCVIENPEDADIAVEIVTLQPGEAVFADNTCRVTKKARIKFI
ncbi:MAG: hypothetical protein K2G77_06370, partial [Muribaculaceae bacterium]|nr:hypothetical protein [Muribaculaceae bacterium]